MPWRALFAALLVAVGFLAPALASGCLPDQIWLGGYFDADDDDAILLLVGDDSGAVLPPTPPCPQRLPVMSLALAARAASADVDSIPSFSPRAPPLL